MGDTASPVAGEASAWGVSLGAPDGTGAISMAGTFEVTVPVSMLKMRLKAPGHASETTTAPAARIAATKSARRMVRGGGGA